MTTMDNATRNRRRDDRRFDELQPYRQAIITRLIEISGAEATLTPGIIGIMATNIVSRC